MKKDVIQVIIDSDTLKIIKKRAKKDNRSVSNYCSMLIKKVIQKDQN